MRFLFGMIVGAALTTGAAYVYDTTIAPPPADAQGPGAKPMVNWDVVGHNARVAAAQARDQWDKLTSK